MKRVIAKLGRTKFHTYKLIAISIKLMLNLIVGAIFYTLNLGLFNTLAQSMLLYNDISIITLDLLQTKYLGMEKILFVEGTILYNGTSYRDAFTSPIFEVNDNLSKKLLEDVE